MLYFMCRLKFLILMGYFVIPYPICSVTLLRLDMCKIQNSEFFYLLHKHNIRRNLMEDHRKRGWLSSKINLLTSNDDYSGRTAPLTSKCCILYIYSTNIGTEYFKHCIYSPFFSLQNAICFIILTYLVPVLFTFYIQVC